MPSNTAAWIKTSTAPLIVDDAPYPSVGPDEIIVRTHAVAINPADHKIQAYDPFGSKYPNILGFDVAGEVVEVGHNVKDLRIGHKTLGLAPGIFTGEPAAAGFQAYVVLHPALTARIPDDLPYSHAVVLPVGVATAAAALYQSDTLNLPLPGKSSRTASSGRPQAVVVWGGSSSVGSCAIQLARASGYEVYATAGAKNQQYCNDLGATGVFEHTGANVEEELVRALHGKDVVGFVDAISLPQTFEVIARVAARTNGSKAVASVSPGSAKDALGGIEIKEVLCTTIMGNGVGTAVFGEFLPKALAEGRFKAKPDPVIVGRGWEKVQDGIDRVKEGVSAAKLVVKV